MLRNKIIRAAGGSAPLRDLFQISRVDSFTDAAGNATVNLTGLNIRSGDLVVLAVMGADLGNSLSNKLSSVSVSINGTTTQTETQRLEDTYNNGRNACLVCDCIASTNGSSIKWIVTRFGGVADTFGSAACVVVAADVASSLGLGLSFAAVDNDSRGGTTTLTATVNSLDSSESIFIGFGFEEGDRVSHEWLTVAEDLRVGQPNGCVSCGTRTGTQSNSYRVILDANAPCSALAIVYD